jgi:hypothetical protein
MFIFSLIIPLMLAVHPIHVSVTEITLDEKEKELEIVSRIFVDDLEKAIREVRNQPNLNLLEPGSPLTTDALVQEYVIQRFKISLDGQSQKTIYLGHEIENEAILCYIQVKNVKRFKSITILNSVITELHDDQSNLVHVTVREKIKSLRLMKDNSSGTLTFDLK